MSAVQCTKLQPRLVMSVILVPGGALSWIKTQNCAEQGHMALHLWTYLMCSKAAVILICSVQEKVCVSDTL